jgi:sulfite reductase (NADPH) hemoprotein beta-component
MSEKHPGPLVVEGKLTDAERMKLESNYLRGTIAEDLNDGLTGGFKGDNFLLIRFHGMYQQDDRDIRAERAEQKLEPRHAMLLRCRLPGGVITTKQWQAIDKFAADNTIYGSIRLTNRQTFQFHGILKKNVKPVHQMLHSVGLDALATANDMNRNVLCTSNPYESELHAEAYEWAKKISEHLLPRTRAYAEIWLDQEKVATTDEEPILGQTYLPRKFKTTVVIPPQNDIDLHANDMNFVAIAENGKLVGFNLLVGGGLSIEHGNKKTYARTASEFGFCRWSTRWRWRKRWSPPSATGVTVPTVKMRKPNTPWSAWALRPSKRKWSVGRASSLSRSVRTNSPVAAIASAG